MVDIIKNHNLAAGIVCFFFLLDHHRGNVYDILGFKWSVKFEGKKNIKREKEGSM